MARYGRFCEVENTGFAPVFKGLPNGQCNLYIAVVSLAVKHHPVTGLMASVLR